MKNDKRTEYLTRDTILKLLSNEENACVSNAESEVRLADGDEYVDLEALDLGVQHAHGQTAAMGHVLPKRQVHRDTWTKILAQLHANPNATA